MLKSRSLLLPKLIIHSKRLAPRKSTFKVITMIAAAAVTPLLALAANSFQQEPAAPEPPAPLASLKTVPIPEPPNLGEFVANRTAAIKLGKALFWDMQVGSDGITACASCHFNAGADNRTRNQISPGLLQVSEDATPNPDTAFTLGGPNRPLIEADFPFHKLSNVNNRNSVVLSDSNDVASSQGVFNGEFIDAAPGSDRDIIQYQADSVFNVSGTNVRRVEPRNTPSVINAVFNFRNFWDGRAQNIFNGLNPFGRRDPHARVVKATGPNSLQEVQVRLENASLASQAVGPPISSFEMSGDGRTFYEIGDRFGEIDHGSKSASKGKKLGRKLGKKLLPLRPLGKQLAHLQDSVLGSDSRSPLPGLRTATYQQLIEAAFKPEWWNSNRIVRVNADGSRTFTNRPDRDLTTSEYTLTEFNFALFFGIALQMYQATLVANDTPLDQYQEGSTRALSDQQKRGLALFQGKARCINCHGGAEMTSASVANVRDRRLERMLMGDGREAVYDNGFYNIGVRPTSEDLGVGGADPFGNPLSETRLAQMGLFPQLLGAEPNLPVGTNERVAADGAFKTPGLRNVELTAPYMHNGGLLTLLQVVEFYNRGGDRRGPGGNDTTGLGANGSNLDPDIRDLGLTSAEKNDLVALLLALTDERVRSRKAPFDHPQLFITDGHPWDASNPSYLQKDAATGNARDDLLEVPAVGRNGGTPLRTFRQNLAPAR